LANLKIAIDKKWIILNIIYFLDIGYPLKIYTIIRADVLTQFLTVDNKDIANNVEEEKFEFTLI